MLNETLSPIAERRPDHRLAELAETVPALHVTDSLAKALRLFGTAGLPVLPVVEGDALVGLLHEGDMLHWMAEQGQGLGWMPAEAMHDAIVAAVMRTDYPSGWAGEPLARVLPMFEHHDLEALPVLEGLNRYKGMLTRQKVLAALSRGLRPAMVGGMATPLGVYLTTGHHRAGVGFWGLFLTGVLLTLANWAISLGFFHAQTASGVFLPTALEAVLSLLVFLVVLRLSPLAGYHAAEHQTVNAIEQGLPLTLEDVAGQPREHPRCGTNLMALLFATQLLLPLLAKEPLWLLPAAALVYVTWRRVGGWLQRVFTTKRARRYQLKNGLRAGLELLDAFEERPSYRAGRWRRFWNMGLAQILAGALTTLALLEVAYQLLPSLRGILL